MGYSKLESEAKLMTTQKDKAPSLDWPENGAIELDKVKFKYAADYPYVLKSVSVKIKPNEKVGMFTMLLPEINYPILGWYCG